MSNDQETIWGPYLSEAGFTIIPHHLLFINSLVTEEMHLTASEIMLLITLISFQWKPKTKVFPSIKTLSNRSGISERQIQRLILGLEEKKYIIVNRRTSNVNIFDLSPCIELVKNLIKEEKNYFRDNNMDSKDFRNMKNIGIFLRKNIMK
ncbi:helix-turn-helix domain-containing protein [Elstera litoralis]|uniref:helix-turn-helix domain-containing protein n=1 Tax=Elstera litoralis TaxID=552518 RepID=UPI0018DE9FD9|nr:helix-turn-helix domain-containing protein [Elstera litoralis]